MSERERQEEAWPISGEAVTRRQLIGRSGSAALGLTVGSSLLAACGAAHGGKAQQARTPRDTLVVAVEGDIDTFDPAFTVGSKPSQTTIQNTFDQLSMYKQIEKQLAGKTFRGVDTEKIQGMLANGYGDHDRGARVIFTLRDGLTYHDGSPITAKVVEEGYQRVFESKGISYFLLTMAGVQNPGHVHALDEKRIAFDMTKPNLLFLKNNTMHNTSAVDIKDVKAHASSGDQWATGYFKKHLATGNGPFKMTEYVSGDRIVLERYPGYYLGKPQLAKVIQKIVPEPTDRELLLRRGEVDMIMVPPVKDLPDLDEDPNLRVMSFPNPRNFMLELNNKAAPFDKKEVRQAVAYAVPYDDIHKDVFKGYAQPNKSIIGNGMPSSDFSFWKYKLDLKKAADLLAAAGYPHGDGAPPVTITVRADWEEAERCAILIQANLQKIGLKASIQKLAFAQFNEREQGKKLQAFIDEWLSWVNDPWYHMSWILKSDSPSNYVSYKNPQIDALIDKWTLSTNETGRIEGSKEAQQIVAEDVPLVFLAGPNWNVVARNNVRGYVYYNDELNRYAYMSKA